MGEKLTDRTIAKLPLPAAGNVIHFDSDTKGLGVRVTAAGAKAFVLCYRNQSGRQRRLTIGSVGDWTIGAARAEAKNLKRQIDRGDDPLGGRMADRSAPTVAELCQRFITEHLPKKRPATQRDYQALINRYILPGLGSHKVVDLRFADIDALHRKVTGPYQANRVIAVLSKMLNLAVKWEWCGSNPCKSLERHHEEKRERYLTPDELDRLGKALVECSDQQGCHIIRLLLLTDARSGEVRAMKWADINFETGVWTKPASSTKQNRVHRIPLSAAARELLERLRRGATGNTPFVFSCPSNAAGYRAGVKYTWARLCKMANIEDCRVHDLRHTYASVLVSSGHSLPIIGRLLGHSQSQTTHRYAHLQDDPLRLATEKAGALINGTRH